MSGTQNRETALKNAINRSISFPDCIINGASPKTVYKIAKIETNAFYKFFIEDNSGAFSIEILNKSIFSVNGHPEKEIYAKIDTDGNIYIKGIAGAINIVVDYFEEFSFEVKESTSNNITDADEFSKKILTYTKAVKTPSLTVGNNLSVNNLVTSGNITVETITFGNWKFSLGEGKENTTDCFISYNYNAQE